MMFIKDALPELTH